jgi:hypothetical protein
MAYLAAIGRKHNKKSGSQKAINQRFVICGMKRFILRLLVFVVSTACCYILLLFIVGRFAPESANVNLLYTLPREGYSDMRTRLKEVADARDVDVLVLGSSHAYRGYDPRIFQSNGIRIFNLGSSGQTPLQTEVLVNRYLESVHPRSVLFDVNPALFAGDGAGCVADILQNSPINADVIRMAADVNNMRVYNSLVYSECRQLLGMNGNIRSAMPNDSDKYVSGGFVETYRPYQPAASIARRRIVVSPAQLRAFDRILALLKRKAIPFVLVQAPETVHFYRAGENNEEMDSLLASRGVYYNFNKLSPLPDSLFYNDEHLNQGGVEAFDGKLIQMVYRK